MVIKLEPADECRTQLLRVHPRKRSPRYAHIGVTNDVRTRLEQHRSGRATSFVQKYKVFRLVHVETFATSQEAIAREKELKFRKRDWKIKLIEEDNPDWNDRSGLI
jgi:putative endonuclease